MRNLYLVCLCLILFAACEREAHTPTSPISDTFDPAGATLLASGMFVGSGGYTVTGTASVYEKDGTRTLVLDPYSSSNGPDLRVYLSRDEQANSALNLGFLKSTTGKQSYAIPGNANIAEFLYVHIWCQQFSVQFGRAALD